MWYVFASLLLVSVGARRYDQGPQTFYDVTSDSETTEQNGNNEVILYLTPEQVKSLEADGAVVQSAEESENDESEPELSAEPKLNEQDEASEQDEIESAQEEEETQEEEQENLEEIQNQDIDFEEILRILNEDQQEEEVAEEVSEEQTRTEPQVEEENTENLRNFSPRITVRQQLEQQQQEERYLTPQTLESYSLVRYQPNEQRTRQRQRNNIQLLQQQQEEANAAAESSEEPETEAPAQEKKKYKLIPYEVLETPASQDTADEQAQNVNEEDDAQRLNELISSLVNAKTFTRANVQRRTRLESVFRKMKSSPKYNNQKYAFEIERFMSNMERQNAASKIAPKGKPTRSTQQLDKKGRLNKSKLGKGSRASARNAKSQKTQQLRFSKSSVASGRSIAVPVMRSQKLSQRSIAVPVETNQRFSFKNGYVRARTDKPYIISRRVSEKKRQNPVSPRK